MSFVYYIKRKRIMYHIRSETENFIHYEFLKSKKLDFILFIIHRKHTTYEIVYKVKEKIFFGLPTLFFQEDI